MNILAWNVQGLGNDWTFRILHDHVQQYSPSLVFLSETISSKAQMERLSSKLGYSGMLTWEREGRSGGLCFLWSDSITVQLLSGSKGHIDVMVTFLNSTCWRFTGLYGNPDTSLRPQFWDLMKRLGDSSSLPWLCGGDLNEILFGHEKQGGAERAQYLMSHFREAINHCGLADLGFRGPKFTWNRGHGACLVQERLDRMLGNSGWLDLFPNSLVHHLNLRGSDHRPLLVELLQAGERSAIGKSWKRGRFHFEEAWADEEEYLEGWNLESFSRLKTQVRKAKTAFDRIDKHLSCHNWKEHQFFVADDVKTAVFQMAHSKSPGADGISINETIITLLPKIKNLTWVTDFRPISLCNVLYKIISKMLANRLRQVMDNAISGFECLHAIKRKRTKKNYLALKLDMAKAYDMVEWDFIQRIMNKLGFSDVWTRKIMACISSGLRCGIRGPNISHLLFADDSLFFLEAQLSTCATLKQILRLYETASGQVVNLSKSAVCFGPNLSESDATQMTALLGVPKVRCHEKYLGLPCFSGRNKQGIFSSIRDRVWNKLCGWKSKLLSAGGREILSKSVIQAIPTYAMNLFKLPSILIRELHRLCAQFWWGGEPGKRRMHWCNWEMLCSHKSDGGMGFRDLRLFNKAILAKQAWRIHSHPTSLAARVLQGFYFHRSSFLQVKVNSSSSFVWRSILWGRELYKQGIWCKIGSGQNTYIYHDCWLPRAGVFKISSPRVLGKFDKVNSLITALGSWDSSLI
ncbi:hypothetical protein UlMin_006319 [Ulmus minor]